MTLILVESMSEVLKTALTKPLPQKQAPEKERPEAVIAPDGLPGGTGGGETPPEGTASPDELRSCSDSEDSIKQ